MVCTFVQTSGRKRAIVFRVTQNDSGAYDCGGNPFDSLGAVVRRLKKGGLQDHGGKPLKLKNPVMHNPDAV